MEEPQEQAQERARAVNRPARVSMIFALVALVVASFSRFGAGLGLAAVVFGIWGVLEGEKTEVGIPLALFGVILGLVAVLWAAASYVAR